MSTLTIRLPDETVERLRVLARLRGQSLNKLIEQMSAQTLSAYDMEKQFHALASQADVPTAIAILDRLDAQDHER